MTDKERKGKKKNAKSSVMQPKFRMRVEKSKKEYKRKDKYVKNTIVEE